MTVTDAPPLDLAALREAAARIRPALLRTPQWHNEALSREFGATVLLKLENLQLTGSFKLRGATHKLMRLAETGLPLHGVIAASAGNHAQGVARAAQALGVPAVVVMPESAAITKIRACADLGARIELAGENLEQAAARAHAIADAEGLAFVHPYDDWDVIAGQASCGLEMLEDCPGLTVVLVPLGGGGLLAGVAAAIKQQRPQVRVVGVQTEAVAPWRHFLQDGKLGTVPAGAHTIADGIRVKRPGQRPAAVIARHVDAVVTVGDDAIAEAMVLLLERTRTIGEGAGVVGLAALMRRAVPLRPDDVAAVVVSGGNVDMSLVGRSIDFGLAASGRLMSVAVLIPDTPGSLARLLKSVAALGINVRHVEHRRGELHVAVGMTEVLLQMETRDAVHQAALLARFAGQGILARKLAD